MSVGPLSWLMLAGHVPPDGRGGGMVRYVVELARALSVRDDVDLHVLADRSTVPFWAQLIGDERRVHVELSGPTAVRSLGERLALSGRALREPFDVVHGTKHFVPRHVRGRRLLTVHDMLLLDRPEDFGRAKRTLLPRPYLASIRDAESIVCVSEATRHRLLAYVPQVSRRITVVPQAPSSTLLAARPVAVDALAGRRFALVVGDASPRKNLAMLVDNWAQVARDEDWRLVVCGPAGWGTNQIGRAERDPRVMLLGHVSDEQLAWCYTQAALVVCPSLLEGFGLPAAEARAFGARLLISEDPALAEAAGGGATTVPVADVDGFLGAARDLLGTPGRDAQSQDVRTWDDVADETVRAARLSPTSR